MKEVAAALASLLGRVRSDDNEPNVRINPFFRKKLLAIPSTQLLLCRSGSPSIESAFTDRFGNDRFKLSEAMKQVRSISRSRVEWESKPGANVMQMTICALIELVRDHDGSACQTKLNGESAIRFQCGDNCLDVSLGRDGAIFTAFSSNDDDSEKLERSAAASIGADIGNNVRSYSYSWSSGDRIFDPHNPFGEMESMLNHFLGGHHDTFEMPAPQHAPQRRPMGQSSNATAELEGMSVQVIIPSRELRSDRVDWSSLAGYDKVKSQVEESVILGLKHPSLFRKILDKTRGGTKSASNRPRVVLFEGPPGTGKSSTARIISNETNVPMIHIPLESVVSKWFGESEKQMARIYELAREVAKAQGASSVILFIDEVDSLVSSRDIGTPHEASKRILSVMLRQIDGFNSDSGVQCTLICATNRKKDLDKAFLSRVDSSIHFGLPSEDCRAKILKLYAKHLTDSDLAQLAAITDGLSGRNLKDICQAAERAWAAHVVRGLGRNARDDEVDISPPPLNVYVEAAKEKTMQQIS